MYRQSETNLLNIDISSTCPHNMVNFRLLSAEIRWRVWSTPANFNGFRVLAALLHGSDGTLVVGVSQTWCVEQRAPPIFVRATITLSIGPHSSRNCFAHHCVWHSSTVHCVAKMSLLCLAI